MLTKRYSGFSLPAVLLSTLFMSSSPVSAVDLVNVSSRGEAGQGAKQMVVGVVVKGSGRKQYMISGIGPTTGVAGAIRNPELNLFNQATGDLIYHCDDWKNCLGSSIVQVFLDQTGQSLTNSEAAASISLEEGAYSIEIRDADGGTGIALGAAIEIPTDVESDDVDSGTWMSEDGSVCFNVALLGEPRLTTDSSECPNNASLWFNLDGKTEDGEDCKATSFTEDDVIIDNGQFYWEGTIPGGSDIETLSGVFFETGFATGSATERNPGASLTDACIAEWDARP